MDAKIRVLNFPRGNQNLLRSCLVSHPNNGGRVMEMYEGDGFVDVQFAERDVATHFRTIGCVNINDNYYKISSVPNYELEESGSIQITGLSSSVEEVFLLIYLENVSRASQDSIKIINYNSDEGYATCFFKEPEALEKILQKETHELLGCHLNVTLISDDLADFKKLSCGIRIKMTPMLKLFELQIVIGNLGPSVENLYLKDNENLAVVTYGTPEDVKQILAKPISYERVSFKTEIMIPSFSPATHDVDDVLPETLIFKNLPISFQTEDLVDYFRKHSIGTGVSEVLYTRFNPGVVMVVFKSHIDFASLQRTVYSKPFMDRMLGIQQVRKPRSVQIFDVSGISRAKLENYFGSFLRRGTLIKKSSYADDFAVLTFEDPSIVESLSEERNYNLEGRVLNASLYYEEFGLLDPRQDGRTCECWLPNRVVVRCKSGIVNFLLRSEDCRKELDFKLRNYSAAAEWPSLATADEEDDLERGVELTVTFDGNVVSDFEKLKSWQSDCRRLFDSLERSLSVRKVTLQRDLWSPVASKLFENLKSPSRLNDNKKIEITMCGRLLVLTDAEGKCLTFVGPKEDVRRALKSLEDLESLEERKLRKNKLMETKHLTNLKPHQVNYLKKSNCVDSLRGNVEVDFGSNETASLTGLSDDVMSVQIKIQEFLSRAATKKLPVEHFVAELLRGRSEFKDCVERVFANNSLTASWSVSTDDRVRFCARDATELDRACGLLKSTFVERKVSLDKFVKPTLELPEWKEKFDELHSIPLLRVEVSDSKVTLTGLEASVRRASDSLDSFFDAHAVYEEDVVFPRGKFSFIKKHFLKNMVESLLNESISSGSVAVRERDCGYNMKGTKSNLESGIKNAGALLEKVRMFKKNVSKLGFNEFIDSPYGKLALNDVEQRTQTLIEIHGEDEEEDGGTSSSGREKCIGAMLQGRVLLTVVRGSIVESDSDVIVNAANQRLSHVGGVAKVISDAAGPRLQAECLDHVAKRGQLKVSEVFVSTPGDLKFKAVLHVVGPHYSSGRGRENQLYDAIQNVLRESDRRGWKKIALPAISTGVYSFPLRLAARVIVQGIVDFASDLKNVTDVEIVDVNAEAVKEFKAIMESTLSKDIIFFPKKITLGQPDQQKTKATGSKKSELLKQDHPPLKFVKGSLMDQTVDVLVNSAAKDLDLSNGTIAKLLSDKAGSSLQAECSAHVKDNGKLSFGEIFVSKGYSLPCTFVFHGLCVSWSMKNLSEQSIRLVTRNSLKEASKRKCKSIAMPSFGTGVLAVPPALVAKWMYEETDKFFNEHPNSSLVDLRVVVYDKDYETIKGFEDFLNKGFSNPQVRVRKLLTPENPGVDNNEVESGFSMNLHKIVLEVCVGDLTAETTDAIVNSTNQHFDFSIGGVSQAIAKKCGQKVIDECRRIGKLTLLEVTTSGELPCKLIFHVNADNKFDVIKECLTRADELKLSSLSFPLLMTGSPGHSFSEVIKVLFNTIEDFAKQGPKHLSKVRIVVFDRNKIDEIKDVLMKELSGFWKRIKGYFYKTPVVQDYMMPKHSMGRILCIYALSEDNANNAVKELEGRADNAMTEGIISDGWQSTIAQLNEKEIDAIKNLERSGAVRITIDLAQKSITVNGYQEISMKIRDSVLKILRAKEECMRSKDEAESVSKQVRWYYKKKDYMKYPLEINVIIEKAYISKSKTVSWNEDVGKYKIDFEKMLETHQDNPNNTCLIKRVGQTDTFPISWDPMKQDLELFEIMSDSKEYMQIWNDIFSSKQANVNKILKIQRIQNKPLFQQYAIKREDLIREHRATKITIEKTLWHDSLPGDVSTHTNGFNRSRNTAPKHALGQGSYFYESFSDAQSASTAAGGRSIYRCLVLIGRYTVGTANLKDVPLDLNDGRRYNSIVDDVDDPTIHVIFNDVQAYPEYLIHYD